MVVDAHHHFWDPALADYPFLTDELEAIRRRFGPQDLEPDLRAAGIDATVLVQTLSSREESRRFLATAAEVGWVTGVVAWVDLTSPAVGDELSALCEAPGGERLVGIRHQVHDEPDAEWLLRPDVDRGLRAVAAAGLAYDLLLRPRELPAGLEVARRHPELRLVIDHLAKPEIRAGRLSPWQERMAPFAELEHVSCKLSGMVTEADWDGWRVDQLAPYVERALGWFGPRRLIFGSDWPVCLVAARYREVKEALEELLAGLEPDARERVFGRNAAALYGLAELR